MKYLLIVLGISMLILTGCTKSEAPATSSQLQQTSDVSESNIDSGKAKLMFFMNPFGRPCQMQDQTLNEIRTDVEAVAEIIYVRTDRNEDRNKFYEFGVRSLPAMILVDDDNQIIKRFTPGIQGKSSILTALKDMG